MPMWNEPNRDVVRLEISQDRRELAARILQESHIPPTGFCVSLDNWEDLNYPNPVWRNLGVHMNLERGGTEEISPDHLLELMQTREHAHLVWVSRRACLASDTSFTWILAHELRHGWQDLRCPELAEATNFLHHSIGMIDLQEPKLVSTIPGEFDADLGARAVLDRIFGSATCDDYIGEEIAGGMMAKPEVFQQIADHPKGRPYDPVAKTIALLRKYEKPLEALKARLPVNDYRREFDIRQAINALTRCSFVGAASWGGERSKQRARTS